MIGDNVVIAGNSGTVHDITWRSVTIRDFNGNNLTIPNSQVASSTILNHERPDTKVRRTFDVEVGYDVPPHTVIRLLVTAMKESRYVVDDPPPVAAFLGFSDHGVLYDARFWIAKFDDWWVSGDEVGAAIWLAFKRAGVQFSLQTREIKTQYESEDSDVDYQIAKPKPEPDLFALFRAMPIFAPVADNDIETLVLSATRRTFSWPEQIIRQDDIGDSIFLNWVSTSLSYPLHLVSEAAMTAD